MLNCLFPMEHCQRHKCLRQQIIKGPLFIATSVEIFVCACVCVCVLASSLAMVTQHKWAACPFLSAGASSSSQGPRRGMKGEQMVWGCSEIPLPRAVSSWQAEHAREQGGLSKYWGDARGL